jgi:uncharacterized membrane protein YdbT with pleckstrin-like domain
MRGVSPEAAALAGSARDHAMAEQELWQGHPSAKAMIGSIVSAALLVVVLAVGAVLLFDPLMGLMGRASDEVAANVTRQRETYAMVLAVVVTVVVVIRLLILAWHLFVLKSHHYRITNQRIVIESGVFSKHIEEIDIRTVADLEFRQSLFERILAIGDITLISSDRSAGRIRLQGLARPRELRELVRDAAYKATKGQLFTRET